ncbi:MAG: bifunctional 4-hydroxy-2-oxoglutarate aldolase/2-dehydro-3-deoxy-phosphogluconate aldolase [Propionibacteriaceae bacterium]|jgi:2-dehydro-3-deoxyphosphogluconate aldolase/(4S)-4-hydroxy-2-oxoglutarate aldolase|nr:bifunctional 4-hydroxy-2-oxoglutarate aldolase/2-dehydro-3-deoxy-phosphogluconate aldolase [Propionibacteriaceae bacterium]
MSIENDLTARRIIPVVVLNDAKDAEPLADALVKGDLPVAEVTFRTAAAADSIKAMAARGDMLVGAGTVITTAQVEQAIEAGAKFIVSPGFSPAVVKACQEAKIPVFPGAVTASEIQAALEFGLTTLKFFPAETSGGVKAIKAFTAPFGQVKFIPTGGVGPANLMDYLSVPAVAAVGGSWMVASKLVEAGDFAKITELSAQAVAMAKEA